MTSPEGPAEPVPAPAWTAATDAPRPRGTRKRPGRALMWAVLGFLLAASVLLFPLGLLTLPFVVAACWSLGTRGPHGAEVLALGVGVAAFTGWIAAVNVDGGCDPSPDVVVLAPGESQSCAGTDGGPFAVFTGAVLLLVALAYVVERVRRSRTS